MISGCLGDGHVDAFLPIDRNRDIVAAFLQTPRQHVAVHLVVFYQEYLCHSTLLEGV